MAFMARLSAGARNQQFNKWCLILAKLRKSENDIISLSIAVKIYMTPVFAKLVHVLQRAARYVHKAHPH